jgi:hypothetical protein
MAQPIKFHHRKVDSEDWRSLGCCPVVIFFEDDMVIEHSEYIKNTLLH